MLLNLNEFMCVCNLFGPPLCLSFNLSFSALSVFSLALSVCLSRISLSTHTYNDKNASIPMNKGISTTFASLRCGGCVVLWLYGFVVVCVGCVS